MALQDEERTTVECVESALAGYVACGRWLSKDGFGDSLEEPFYSLAPEAMDAMRADVYDFLCAAWDAGLDLSPIEPGQIGHDLWLTRNGHGAGFWDRGMGELGDRLTDLARPYGECALYVGDHDLVHYTT